jgi:hypothetical protein
MEELEGVLIYELAKKVAEQKTDNEHLRAVQAQIQVTNQIYFAIFRMVGDQNGIAAESLLRTLFDSVINCIVLAKHKEKLQDFIRNGQFSYLRLLRFNDAIPEKTKPLIASTEDDWKVLFPEFKSTDWHKLGTKDSFIEAEYIPEMYDKYFRRASSYAHAEPYITVRPKDKTWKSWGIEVSLVRWKNLTIGVYGLACNAMLHMLAIVNREFELGIDAEFEKPFALVKAFKAKHIETIKQALANEDSALG